MHLALCRFGGRPEATATLRIGTLVLNNDLRHPAIVARQRRSLSTGCQVDALNSVSAQDTASPSTSRQASVSTTERRVADFAEALEVLDGCSEVTTSPSQVTTTG